MFWTRTLVSHEVLLRKVWKPHIAFYCFSNSVSGSFASELPGGEPVQMQSPDAHAHLCGLGVVRPLVGFYVPAPHTSGAAHLRGRSPGNLKGCQDPLPEPPVSPPPSPLRQLRRLDRPPRPAWLAQQALASHSFLDAGESKLNVRAGGCLLGTLFVVCGGPSPCGVLEGQRGALPGLGRTNPLLEALPPHAVALRLGF